MIFSKNIYIYIIILSNCSFIFCIEPIIGGIVVGGAVASYFGWNLIKCSTQECCHEKEDYILINFKRDQWIRYDLSDLEQQFARHLYGQPLVEKIVPKLIKAHLRNNNPEKALVLSFNGMTGSGKNYASKLIARSLYRKFKQHENSEFVNLIIATRFNYDSTTDINQVKDLKDTRDRKESPTELNGSAGPKNKKHRGSSIIVKNQNNITNNTSNNTTTTTTTTTTNTNTGNNSDNVNKHHLHRRIVLNEPVFLPRNVANIAPLTMTLQKLNNYYKRAPFMTAKTEACIKTQNDLQMSVMLRQNLALQKIAENLPVRDRLNLRLTCRTWKAIVDADTVWKIVHVEDIAVKDWKKFGKEIIFKHKSKKIIFENMTPCMQTNERWKDFADCIPYLGSVKELVFSDPLPLKSYMEICDLHYHSNQDGPEITVTNLVDNEDELDKIEQSLIYESKECPIDTLS